MEFVNNASQTIEAGGKLAINDDAFNQGAVSAAPSTTRYYLSKDVSKGPGDILLIGSRAVPALNPSGHVGSATILLTIPANTAGGLYVPLACADDTNAVKETSDTNNCASGSLILVTR